MKYVNLISLIFMLSCSEPNGEKANSIDTNPVSQPVTSVITPDSIIAKKPVFDYKLFTVLGDSLVTLIADEKIKLTCEIDTIKHTKAKSGYYRYLLAGKNSYMLVYRFYTGRKRSLLRFKVLQAVYPDNDALDKAFFNLKLDADSMYKDTAHSAHNFSPGLTYENDYVLKTDKQLFWLNLPCPYSFKNNLRMRQQFKSCLNIPQVKDSIICWCGQGKCDK